MKDAALKPSFETRTFKKNRWLTGANRMQDPGGLGLSLKDTRGHLESSLAYYRSACRAFPKSVPYPACEDAEVPRCEPSQEVQGDPGGSPSGELLSTDGQCTRLGTGQRPEHQEPPGTRIHFLYPVTCQERWKFCPPAPSRVPD